MRTKRARLLGIGLLGVLAAAVAVLAVLRGDAEALAAGFEFDFPPGTSLRYDFDYRTDSSVDLFETGAPADGVGRVGADVAMVGTLVLRSFAEHRGDFELGLRIASFDQLRFEVMGRSIVPDGPSGAEALTQPEARLRISRRGEIRDLRFPAESPHLFRRLVHVVVAELQVQVRGQSAEWQLDETTQHGVAPTAYSWRSDSEAPLVLDKKRSRYHSFQALRLWKQELPQAVRYEGVARLQSSGQLASLLSEESIRVDRSDGVPVLEAQSQFELRLVATESFDIRRAAARGVALTPARALGDIEVTQQAEQNALAQRVAGMTREQMLADLTRFGIAGRMPDHNRWLWRVTGLLKQFPELCQELVAVFEKGALGRGGRRLVLDLLVGAGHAQAQAALLSALESKVARSDPNYNMLFQRLSLVKHPSDETLAYLAAAYAGGSGRERRAAMYSLASSSGHRYRDGDAEAAHSAVAPIVADLGRAEQAEERALLVGALGNAGLPEHTELIAGYAGSESFEVRIEVAGALRKIDSAASRAALLGLAGDDSYVVQQRAVRTLAKLSVDEGQLISLESMVRSGAIEEKALDAVIALVTPHLHTQPTARRILEAILARPLEDSQIKARVRGLLGA